MTKLTHEGYHVSINKLGKKDLDNIITDLTVYPNKPDITKEEIEKTKFSVYKYNASRTEIIVPRYYGVFKFGQPKEMHFDPEEVVMDFKKELRDKQKLVAEKCVKYILKHGGGLLSVPCGFGKTVCALYIAYRLGLKTLVVVHKSNLLTQWIERIKEFLGVDNVGIIQQGKCSYNNRDIVVGMIHTISKREYKDVFNKFGFVIYDEAHHVSCRYFSRSLMKTGAQYTLSLTATPYRSDGLIKIMYWFLGGTIYREKIKMNKNVIAKIIKHKSTDKLFTLKKRWLKGEMRPDTCKMITNICNIELRNQIIVDIINVIRRKEPERKILILSERTEHLKKLKKDVDDSIQDDIDSGLIQTDETLSCLYIGDTKLIDRGIAEERGDIIFATYSMAHEGLDIKHLNTVILASPKKDVVQSIGRIMRKILESGDVRPMIIDIADDINAINNWSRPRKSIYMKCNYEIENYYLIDDKLVSKQDYSNDKLVLPKTRHHNDAYINKCINNFNKCMISHQKDLKKFRELCEDIDKLLGKSENIFRTTPIEKRQYKVFNNLESTEITQMLYVPKLNYRDFECEVVKDAENIVSLDISNDLSLDLANNDCSIFDLLKKPDNINKANNIKKPVKSLFRKN